MTAISCHQMRRMEVERTIGRASGLTGYDAWQWAANARAVLVKARAWLRVADEGGFDVHVLPALVDQLGMMIVAAESAYLDLVVADCRASVSL